MKIWGNEEWDDVDFLYWNWNWFEI